VQRGLVRGDEQLSDREVLDLIFAPGFSTAERVSDVSGRGVGMDVVRRNIERIRSMVLDILYYAKDREPDWQPVSAEGLVNDVYEAMADKARGAMRSLRNYWGNLATTPAADMPPTYRYSPWRLIGPRRLAGPAGMAEYEAARARGAEYAASRPAGAGQSIWPHGVKIDIDPGWARLMDPAAAAAPSGARALDPAVARRLSGLVQRR
jgi:hypothetical protein